MLLDRLFENLALHAEAFATCGVTKGWRLVIPDLDWVSLHFVMKGDGVLAHPGGALPLPRYSLAIVPPHLVHSLDCDKVAPSNEAKVGDKSSNRGPVPMHIAGSAETAALFVACGRIKATYGEGVDLFSQLREILVVDFSDSGPMRDTFESILQEQESPGPASDAMMSALMNRCLVLLFRKLSKHPDCKLPWLAALEDPRLARALEVMLAKPEQPHTLESLADLAGMSRSVFARRFHSSFGRTPMGYLREVRLRSGARLLGQGELSIDTVASRVGFASRSHFSRAFRDQFGQPPTAFRSQAG